MMTSDNLSSETPDFEFLKLLLQYEQQEYNEIKEDCLRKGVLFEDDLFPANSSSYCFANERPHSQAESIEWLRPSQLVGGSDDCNQPRFIRNATSCLFLEKTRRNMNHLPSKEHQTKFNFQVQLNVLRGSYGCSNFISSLPILFWNEENFLRVVPEAQSFDSNDYSGIFHFRIWQYGKWYDIVVDDRLPTLKGKLIQVHTHNNVEFWPALLEKAFAKLNGCYQSLHGCDLAEFLEDMTGGMCESISSDMPIPLNESLFNILSHSMELQSQVIVRVSDPNKSSKDKAGHVCKKRQLASGLIKNQSYVVLETKQLDRPIGSSDKCTHLIKLCNPWKRINQMTSSGVKSNCSSKIGPKSAHENERGWSDGKWIGSWSERSTEWINLSDEDKTLHGLLLDCDSHFWMPIESFVETFTDVDICHINDQIFTSTTAKDHNRRSWQGSTVHGFWITAVSAGGCFNEETFYQNPAYVIPIHKQKNAIKSPKEALHTPKELTNFTKKQTVLIGLMQKYRNSKRLTGKCDLKIGFHLFRLESDCYKFIEQVTYDQDLGLCIQGNKNYNIQQAKVRLKMKPEFFNSNKGEHALKYFSNVREVAARRKLVEGNYLLIPSTFSRNCDGNFLLRVFCEEPLKFSDKDKLLTKLIENSDGQIRLQKAHCSERMFSRCFENISSFDESVDAEHLEVLLKSVTTLKQNYFSLDQCQTLLVLYDLDCKGTLSYVQLQQLCVDLEECFHLFLRHDKTVSKSISGSELKATLSEIGINANQAIIDLLVNRFGSKMKIVVKGVPIRELKFPNFAICLLKLRKTLIYWDIKLRNSCVANFADSKIDSDEKRTPKQSKQSECNSTHFTLVEFVKQVIYS